MDIELLGGVLDGKQFPLASTDSAEEIMIFNSPIMLTCYNKLGRSINMSKVIYKRYCVRDKVLYYTFNGYTE